MACCSMYKANIAVKRRRSHVQKTLDGVDASVASVAPYLGDHDHQKVLLFDAVFGDCLLVRKNLA